MISVHFSNYYKYISGLRSEKAELDLNLTRTSPELGRVIYAAALPGGEAVVDNYIRNNKTRQVLRLDSQGRITNNIYSCVGCPFISGLLVLGDYLYIIHYNGTVIETRVSDGRVMNVSTISDVRYVLHTGSLYSKADKIPDKQTLLLCDDIKGEVFTFKPSTGIKQVRITGLNDPRSVSYMFYDHAVFYIVCEGGRHRINVYDNTWKLLRTISSIGSNNGENINPVAAIVSDEDTIIVSEFNNDHISEFSFNSTFLRHPIVRLDGIYWPGSMSYYYPHLWLIHGSYPYKLYRYNLYG